MAAGTGSREMEIVQPGERSSADGKAVCNHILLSINPDEFQLVRPHLRTLHKVAYLIVLDAGRAEDVVSVTLRNAWRGIGTFNGRSAGMRITVESSEIPCPLLFRE